MRIIGVDFSGAQDQKKSATWLAQGRLEGGVLTLETCHPIIRDDLTAWLKSLDKPAVVGMDFPFSVPEVFARCWRPSARKMPDLWAAAAGTDWPDFRALRDHFCTPRSLMPTRNYDPAGSYSPLKWDGNPNMVPMTFWGMRMLHSLWNAKSPNNPLWIPPLPKCQPTAKGHIVLLEVMPGITLDRLSIKRTGAKKGGASELRRKILRELRSKANEWGIKVRFSHKPDLYQTCRANDDALDSVVAAITAAMWHKDEERFHSPEDVAGIDWETVMLEGWLYAPKTLDGNE